MRLRKEKWSSAGRIAAVMVASMAGLWPAGGQKLPVPAATPFRVDSTLVLVPITVTDHRGAIVSGLPRDAFTVTEDGVRQQIRSFTQEDVPVSMGIVLDLSGSMRPLLGRAKESLRTLLENSNPADEAFLNAVSTKPRAYSGFTHSFDEILSRVVFEDAGGNTALVDTVYDSLQQLRSGVHARKALLVISDGMDNHSRHSKGELLERARESDAQIYTIAVSPETPSYAKAIELTEEKRGVLFLDELAVKTGGIGFVVHNRTDIAAAAARIGQVLRNQYTIGYAPRGNSRNSQWRRIKVSVAGSGMRAYARMGYRFD